MHYFEYVLKCPIITLFRAVLFSFRLGFGPLPFPPCLGVALLPITFVVSFTGVYIVFGSIEPLFTLKEILKESGRGLL